MNEVKYLSPTSTTEAISILSRYKRKAKIIAGGTDLVARMKQGEAQPEVIVSIAGVADLNYITYDLGTRLRIGALTPVSAIESSPLIKSRFAVLAQAAGTLGSPTIRQRATIGGNLCNAAPSADTAPALMVLGAKVKLSGKDGDRTVPLEHFFTGPGTTVLKYGEMLTEIQIPDMPLQSGAAYVKQKRRLGADLAVVGVAALVVKEGVTIKDARIVLGAVAPTPLRAKEAETILRGKKPDSKLFEEASQAASVACKPIDDCRSTAGYRKELVAVLTQRAIAQAVEQVKLEV